MVFVAATIAILFGFTALGVDVSHLAHERGRIQHAADSAAFAVAYNCVSSDPGRTAKCDPGTGQPTVNEFVTKNSAGDKGAITNALTPAAGKVTVEVDQTVKHYFAPVIGINTSPIRAKATVAWKKHLTAGEVMPYAVGICQWMKTPYGTDVTLSGRTNGAAGEAKSEFDLPPWKTAKNQSQVDLPATMWTSCSGGVNTPPPSVTYDSSGRTFHDGFWFSKGDCSNNFSNTQVKLKIGDLVCGGATNVNQSGSDAYTPKLNEIIPLAVYAPNINWAYGGLCADPATGDLGKCPDFSSGAAPLFDLKIVGFVPFKVLGCSLGGPGANHYSCGGKDPEKMGLFGQFVRSGETWDGEFEYGETGNNFGAVKVELVE